MRPMRFYVLALLLAAACLFPLAAVAQVYSAESSPGNIISYDGVVGTVVNPDHPVPGVRGISIDEFGRLLIAACCEQADVMRFDIDAQTLEYLDEHVFGYVTEDVYTDPADASIYVIKNGNIHEVTGERCDSFLGVLPGGTGPPDTIYVFGEDETLIDVQVWPMLERAGNILVLVKDGYPGPGFLAEFERTSESTFVRLPDVVAPGSMVAQPGGFAITPEGGIVIVDRESGLYRVVEGGGGAVVPFGEATGPKYEDIEIGSDGTIYLVNTREDWIERYDEDGVRLLPDWTGGITTPTAVTAASFAPTPEGPNSFVEPIAGVQITFENVTTPGFTTAVAESSISRISPEGNYLPDCAELPGTRADHFTYISIATDAVYRGLIQVDVLLEGSRLFYASGVGDTFRDFTVVGSIEDARGTMPRFEELGSPYGRPVEIGPTEVVLVEDTRALSEVTLYKFWRIGIAMETPGGPGGGDPCPWQMIEWLQKYPERARDYYDEGDIGNALSELALMNMVLRSHASWCIPDSSDDELGNIVGKILAHSKTLMHSLELESGEAFTGIDEDPSGVRLIVDSPAEGTCMFTIAGPVGAETAARLYDVSGRLVATVYEGRLPDGGVTVVWDGSGSSGVPAASGVYFARVESGSEVLTSKVVYIR